MKRWFPFLYIEVPRLRRIPLNPSEHKPKDTFFYIPIFQVLTITNMQDKVTLCSYPKAGLFSTFLRI
jgi:hypothetical protein